MREFAFEIRYERGADALMDWLIENPGARMASFLCSLSGDELWRLDRVVGAPSVVEEVTALLTDTDYDSLSVSDRRCDGRQFADVLEADDQSSVVYSYHDDLVHCDAVPVLTNRYVSGGVLFEVASQEDTEQWRILLESDEKAGMLYDTLTGKLRDGLTFQFDHVGDVTESPLAELSSVSVRPEQQRVLELAAEEGYYETPRETTLDELAARLDSPRSTVSYRLRRAEAALVEAYLSTE